MKKLIARHLRAVAARLDPPSKRARVTQRSAYDFAVRQQDYGQQGLQGHLNRHR